MRVESIAAILVIGATLATTGCQRAADAATEAAIERASGERVELDRDGGRMRVRTDEGEMTIATGEGLALPADFPRDLFLPEGYSVNSVMDINGARLVNLVVDGRLDATFDAARAAMEDKGWSQTLAMQQADGAMLGFSRDGREAAYTFTPGGDGALMVGIQLHDRASRQ